MSEYQYYEFQAIDQPLTEAQLREVRELSTRAVITPSTFTNEYHFGDFRGSPLDMMKRYYDAHLYIANWGTYRLMLKVPRSLIDVEAIELYESPEAVEFEFTNGHVVITLEAREEGGEWVEGEGWLPSLLPLRQELMGGDLRPLYLGWLAGVNAPYSDTEEDAPEPPVPAGLDALTPAQRRLANFLLLDQDLLEAAAAASAERPATLEPARQTEKLAPWLADLDPIEKDGLLLNWLQGGRPHLREEMLRRFAREQAPAPPSAVSRRTMGDLWAAARARTEERRRQEAEKRERQRQQREREAAKARAAYLDDLAKREPAAWDKVGELIEQRQAKAYDEAVQLLVDLRDLAAREKREEPFQSRLTQIRDEHERKPTLMRRLDQAGL